MHNAVFLEHFAFIMVIALCYWPQVKKSRREEAVLYDVFPRHIADALVAGKKVWTSLCHSSYNICTSSQFVYD